MTLINVKRWFREPSAINAAQTVQYLIAAAAGALAAVGAIAPVFVSATIGPIIVALVGATLAAGGVVGAFAVAKGWWWLERIALITLGCGWVMLLVPAVFYAVTSHNSSIWLVLALVVTAICDVFKRYRRIDWAYLDPVQMTTADIIIAVLGAGGIASVIPKIIDGLKAWRSGKASEEKHQNRVQLGRIFTAERERDEEASFRRKIEDWAGELVYMLKQIGVPTDKIPPRPERKQRANA